MACSVNDSCDLDSWTPINLRLFKNLDRMVFASRDALLSVGGRSGAVGGGSELSASLFWLDWLG
jgi:hypothetical protein